MTLSKPPAIPRTEGVLTLEQLEAAARRYAEDLDKGPSYAALVVSPELAIAYARAMSPWGRLKSLLRLQLTLARNAIFGRPPPPPETHCELFYYGPYWDPDDPYAEPHCGECEYCTKKK